ncbi:hypothetical protein GLOTRDRAFT_110598, partial [Gloeophyllum trabeum ATCC 11539]
KLFCERERNSRRRRGRSRGYRGDSWGNIYLAKKKVTTCAGLSYGERRYPVIAALGKEIL